MHSRQRAILGSSLLLVLLGLATSVYLTDLHVRANTDPSYAAACDVTEVFRCSDVALSPYSVLLGVPVSVWGLVAYACFAFFIVWGLRARRAPTWPLGLYWLLSAAALLVSVALALTAEMIIGALCIGCLTLYGVNLLLFAGATWLLLQDRGRLRRDLLGLPRNHAVIALGAALVLASPTLMVAYPKYWEVPLQAECDGLPTGVAADQSCWIGARQPVLEIIEFSDYRCPFCRRAHTQMRELVRNHPQQIRLVHKHFPLDTACHPALTRQLHDGACRMARLAYCAGAQGRFWDMNDRLFGVPSGITLDAERLAVEAGLDVGQFLDCVASQAAADHVRSDIQEGMRLQISGTPTFVVDGELYVGTLPDDVIRRYLGTQG